METPQKKEVDLSIANISITSKREKIMDYSHPVYDVGLQILIPAETGKLSYITIIWESGII